MHKEFDEVDKDKSGGIDKEELAALLETLGHDFDDKEVTKTFQKLDSDGSGVIDRDEFALWYREDKPFNKHIEVAKKAQDQDEESLLTVPDTIGGKIMYAITLPLVLLFVATVPDVRKSGRCGR